MNNILYTTAIDEQNNFVLIDNAEKGKTYFCPECKGEFIFCKGKIKRPYFAHKVLSLNCTPENVLHRSFKEILVKKIKNYIEKKNSINMKWECNYCDEEHSGNLLKKTYFVKMEHDLKKCRPDIALFDKNQNVYAVIEIVVEHKPEQSTLDFYNENNIILIQYNLTSDEDIKNMDNIIKEPNHVANCPCFWQKIEKNPIEFSKHPSVIERIENISRKLKMPQSTLLLLMWYQRKCNCRNNAHETEYFIDDFNTIKLEEYMALTNTVNKDDARKNALRDMKAFSKENLQFYWDNNVTVIDKETSIFLQNTQNFFYGRKIYDMVELDKYNEYNIIISAFCSEYSEKAFILTYYEDGYVLLQQEFLSKKHTTVIYDEQDSRSGVALHHHIRRKIMIPVWLFLKLNGIKNYQIYELVKKDVIPHKIKGVA
jgi:hypothetical protein